MPRPISYAVFCLKKKRRRYSRAARIPTSAKSPAPRSVDGTIALIGGAPVWPLPTLIPDTPCAIFFFSSYGHRRHLHSFPTRRSSDLETELSRQMTTSTTSIDIMGLQAAYANLHTDQERDYFMQRYHDVISSFGGKTSYDADNRPLLVMRSNLWASGYDVDGTDQTS